MSFQVVREETPQAEQFDGVTRLKLVIGNCAALSILLVISACSSTELQGPQGPQIDEVAGTITETVGDTGGFEEPSVVEVGAGDEQIVCRYEKTIGSRIGKRTCRTKAEDKAARVAAQEALERNAIRTDKDRVVSE